MVSLERTLAAYEERINDLEAGMYRAALGQGSINNRLIKPRSVLADSIDVANLQAVSLSTGSLNVTGSLTVGTSGAVQSSGKDNYADTTAGFWLGYDSGSATYRMNIGDATKKMTWDGSALTVTGAINAVTGTLTTLTIDGVLTLSGGSAKIIDGDGSYWDVNGIVLRGASGSFGDSLIFNHASHANPHADLKSIFGASTAGWGFVAYPGAGVTTRNASVVSISDNSDAGTVSTLGATSGAGAATSISVAADNTMVFTSGGGTSLSINASGVIVFPGTSTAAAGAYYGRQAVVFNGLTKYLHFFDA